MLKNVLVYDLYIDHERHIGVYVYIIIIILFYYAKVYSRSPEPRKSLCKLSYDLVIYNVIHHRNMDNNMC